MGTRESYIFHRGVSRRCFEPHAAHLELQSVHLVNAVLNTEELLRGMGQGSWFWQGRKNTSPRDARGPWAPSLLWIQNSWKHNPDPPARRQVLYHQKIKSCSVGMRWPLSQMSKLWNIFLRWHLSFLIFWKMQRPERVASGWLLHWLTVWEGTFCPVQPHTWEAAQELSKLSLQQKQRCKGGSLVSNWNTHRVTQVMNWFQKKIL